MKFKDAWKEEFETSLFKKLDRLLVLQSICRHMIIRIDACDVGITWDHKFYTTPFTEREDFLLNVEKTIDAKVEESIDHTLKKRDMKGKQRQDL